MFFSCSSNDYKISGQFEKDATGQVFLHKFTLDGLEPIDTARLVDGAFIFKGKVEFPELYLIFFDKKQEPILVFIENTNINISGNTNNLSETVIKGSKLNDIFDRVNKDVPHQDKMNKLHESFLRAQLEGDDSAIESIIADGEVLMEDIKNYYLKSIRDNIDNVVSAYLLIQAYEMISFEEFVEIVDLLNIYLQDHPYAVGFAEYVEVMTQQMQMYEMFQRMMEEEGDDEED
jgi:hypothetical protein